MSPTGKPPRSYSFLSLHAIASLTVTTDLKALIRREAAAAGFDAVRVASPDAISKAGQHFDAYIAAGRHGDMDWMATHAERRRSPKALWPEARSVIMLGLSYAPDHDPIATNVPAAHGVISAYARGRDYHDVVKKGLKHVARALQASSGADVKVFVDTAPLMEKPLAAAAGIGWQGKHTNLVSREHGSWLFLGAILTSAEIAPDAPEPDHCGSCHRCLDACPTNAFPAPYQLDARRCIAYLTIEHKGHIPLEFRAPIGNRVFGCDDCLAVCPWNKFAVAAREMRFQGSANTAEPPLQDLLALDDAAFRERFRGTPVKRTGRDRILRNALIAAGNAGDPSLIDPVKRHLADPAPIVRAMAVWALSRLAKPVDFDASAAQYLPNESDSEVAAEWKRKSRV
jgi:epoxyqueuosine reductase